MCHVSWSLEVERPRTSMTFERYALKLPCVSRHVSSSFTCLFWMKFMWEVLNSYTIVFGWKLPGKLSTRTIQGSLRKDPTWCQGCPRQAPNDGAVDGLWAYWRPFDGFRLQVLSLGEVRDPWQVSGPTNSCQYDPSVGRRPVNRVVTEGFFPAQALLPSQGMNCKYTPLLNVCIEGLLRVYWIF